jgi:PAS domain S-box-containing protein
VGRADGRIIFSCYMHYIPWKILETSCGRSRSSRSAVRPISYHTYRPRAANHERETDERVLLARERVGHEVSEHRSIEVALRDAGEFFRSVLRHGSDIFTILETDGAVRYQSPSIALVLGYRPEELLGENFFGYVHPEDLEPARAAFAGVVADRGSTCRVEYQFRHADGSWRRLEGVANNLLDDPGVTRA